MTFQPERAALRAGGAAADDPLIALIGSRLAFTPGMQALIELDLGGVRTLRVPSLEGLQQHRQQTQECPALVVVGDALADDLQARPDAYRAAAAGGAVALAYRRVERARALRDALLGRPGMPPGFVPMGAAIEVWLSALRLNLHGEPCLPQELLVRTQSAPAAADLPEEGDAALGRARLTAREREVLPLVAEGRSTKGIARDLGLSQHTVKLHIHNIFSKIGVRNRASATRWYLSRVAAPGWGARP